MEEIAQGPTQQVPPPGTPGPLGPPGAPEPPGPRPIPAGRKPRRSRRGLVIGLVVVGVVGMLAVAGVLVLAFLVAAVRIGAGAVSEALQVKTIETGDAARPVVAVPIHGMIYGGQHAGGSAELVIQQLRQAREGGRACAILLDVDSGGGGVTSSEEIHREVLRCQEAGLPVVAFFRDLAASGGYYVSASADKIVMMPTGITGSIGVRAFSLSAQKLLEDRIGLRNEEVTSAPMKDPGPPWRPLSPAARARIRKIVGELHEHFVGVVAEGRANLSRDQAAALATGEIFSAKEAQAKGLVDALGGWAEAVAAARTLGNAPDAAVVRYVRRVTGLRALMGASGEPVRVEVVPRLPEVRQLRLEYRWAPEAPAPEAPR